MLDLLSNFFLHLVKELWKHIIKYLWHTFRTQVEFDHCIYTDLQDFLMVKLCEMITINFYHFLNDTLVNNALNTIINIKIWILYCNLYICTPLMTSIQATWMQKTGSRFWNTDTTVCKYKSFKHELFCN